MSSQQLFLFDKDFILKLGRQIDKDPSGLLLAGCDEAGRGALAGPVVSASVIMDMSKEPIDGIDDSKKLSKKARERAYLWITENAVHYSVAIIDVDDINSLNILGATKKGMNCAINDLNPQPDYVLIDAVSGLSISAPYQSLIKGDALSYNIACASIIAKVSRDRIMDKLAESFPEYGLLNNKGYGTKEHIAALRKHGQASIHRRLFIRNAFAEQLRFDI